MNGRGHFYILIYKNTITTNIHTRSSCSALFPLDGVGIVCLNCIITHNQIAEEKSEYHENRNRIWYLRIKV